MSENSESLAGKCADRWREIEKSTPKQANNDGCAQPASADAIANRSDRARVTKRSDFFLALEYALLALTGESFCWNSEKETSRNHCDEPAPHSLNKSPSPGPSLASEREEILTKPVIVHASVSIYHEDTAASRINSPPSSEKGSGAGYDTAGTIEIKRLSEDTRVILSDSPRDALALSVKLQVQIQGDWRIIASYDSAYGISARIRYGINGLRSTMPLDLPLSTIHTMAIADFTRNWTSYRNNFFTNRIKGPESIGLNRGSSQSPIVVK